MTCSLLGCCSLQCVQPQSPRKRTPHDSCGAEWPIQLMSSGELKKEFKAVADAQLSDRRFLRQPIHPSHSLIQPCREFGPRQIFSRFARLIPFFWQKPLQNDRFQTPRRFPVSKTANHAAPRLGASEGLGTLGPMLQPTLNHGLGSNSTHRDLTNRQK